MDSLSLHEKIGQLVQLDGGFFGAEEVPTGPCAEMGIEPWVAENAGSVLNVLGAEKVHDIQKRHMEHSRIPLSFMADVVYGYITSYPIPLALACSWDMKLVEECAKNTAYEASADGAQVTFSPMVDVARDARWGRCMESPGEDPLSEQLLCPGNGGRLSERFYPRKIYGILRKALRRIRCPGGRT